MSSKVSCGVLSALHELQFWEWGLPYFKKHSYDDIQSHVKNHFLLAQTNRLRSNFANTNESF